MLLGTNHGRVTTNPNQTELQCIGNIPVHLQPKSLRFRVYHQLGRFYLRVLEISGSTVSPFSEACENVNSASYCEVLLNLLNAISRELLGQLARGVLLRHDNASPHRAQATQKRIQELQWEHLERPHYGPKLAPSDLHLSGLLTSHLGANVSPMAKTLKRRCGSGWESSQNTCMMRVSTHR
jgi:hypothetical protein